MSFSPRMIFALGLLLLASALAACGGGNSAANATAVPPQIQNLSREEQMGLLNTIFASGDFPMARALALQLLADPTPHPEDLPALAAALYSPGPHLNLSGQGPNVYGLQFSEDGQRLFAITCARRQEVNGDSQCAEGALLIWDSQSGQLLHTWPQTNSSLTALALYPDGRQVLTAHCADYETGAFFDSQRRCIAAQINVLDWQSGQQTPSLLNFQDVVRRLLLHPDGQHAAALGCTIFQEVEAIRDNRRCINWSILIWNLTSGQVVFQGDSPGFVVEMAFNPVDPSRLQAMAETADGGHVLYQWAWASGGQAEQINLPATAQTRLAEDTPNRLRDAAFSNDGLALASVYLNADGLWYGLAEQRTDYLPTAEPGPRDYLNTAILFPIQSSTLPGTLLAWAQTSTKQTIIWDVVAGRIRAILAKDISAAPLFSIRADGQQGASYQNGQVTLWQFVASPPPAELVAADLIAYACALPYPYNLSQEELNLAGISQDRLPCEG